jgi:hypothetical protein
VALVLVWPASLVLVQATLARTGSFDVTVGVVACHAIELWLIALCAFRRPPLVQLVVAILLLLQVLVVGSVAADLVQFARSFAQFLNLALMILIASNLKIRDWRPVKRSITVFCGMSIAVAGLLLAQFVSFNVMDDLSLARPLGSFAPALAPGSEQVYVPPPAAPFRRPAGPFSEPSVAGWFMILVAAVALSARPALPRLAAATALVCVAAAAMTQSLTGILGMSILIGAYLLLLEGPRRFKLVLLGLALVLAVLALTAGIGDALLSRADEVHRPGSSIHLRFVGPAEVVLASLLDFPLGTALGQTAGVAELKSFAALLGGIEPAFDNMLFTIVLHFGLIGIALNVGYVIELARWLVLRRRAVGLIMLAILMMLTATGAGWSHQTVLIVGYAIIVGRYLLARDRAQRPGQEPRSDRGRRSDRDRRSDRGRRSVTLPPQPAPRRPERPEAAPPRAAWLRPGTPS